MTGRTIALIIGLAAIAAGTIAFFTLSPRSLEEQASFIPIVAAMSVGNVPVRVAIADTEATRTRGLSGYAPLESDEGMLFVFPEDGRHSFWMKDMLFSIDILWLDEDGRIVHIERNVSPETFPTAFMPDSPARYVLEVSAGFCDMHGVIVNDAAILP